ncbi:MAG: hypothetical protein RBU21_22885 [FCB group bacterium]|jgi:hypothetical protein|nr:hypothetical protein [FCB group bacterium]
MRILLLSVVLLGLNGCILELLTTTAIQGELQAQSASTAAKALEYAKESTGQTSGQRAIDLYKADKGENPPSLEALVPNYIDKVPTHEDGSPYGYDPATGTLLDAPVSVAVAPTPTGPTAGDWQTLTELNNAIRNYANATGTYPPTLYSLVPGYLPAVPKTAGGQDFTYDPQYGAAYLPQSSAMGGSTPPPAAAVPRGAGAVGGGGPMGEAMTGIGISNQLDSMNNSATSSAGSRAGGTLQRSQDEHNQQQEKALGDLGL